MYKKLLTIVIGIAALSSCKKDDGGGGSGPTVVSGPQVVATGFIGNYGAGAKLGGYMLDSGVIKVPASDTGLTFNYGSVSTANPWKDTLKTPGAAFSSATYMRGASLALTGQNVSLNRYFQLSTTNWLELGDDYSALSLTIPMGTGNFPAQTAAKVSSQVLASFPLQYGDSSQQVCNSQIYFDVTTTVPVLGTISGPVLVKQETTVKSRNMAWGTLNIAGYATPLQAVVQRYTTSVKTNFSSTSATIGALIPTMLSTYGITNDQVITTTLYRFWVPNKGLVMTLNADGTATVTTGL